MKPAPPLSHRVRRLVLAGCIVLWLGAFVLTHTPKGHLPEVDVSDKSLHAVGYFALGSALLWTLAAYGVRRATRFVTVVVVLAIYAGLDEITQPLVNRHASVGDWLADLVGAAAAAVTWAVLLSLKRSSAV